MSTPTLDQTPWQIELAKILFKVKNHGIDSIMEGGALEAWDLMTVDQALAAISKLMLEQRIDEVQHEIDFLLDDYKRTDNYHLKMAANRMEARLNILKKGI